MKTECRIRVEGHQDAEVIVAEARYHEKNGRGYIFFEHETDGAAEKYSLKFDADSLEYNRKGVLRTSICLKKGEKTYADYVTPYGNFRAGFETTEILVLEEAERIRILAEYNLSLNDLPHEKGKIRFEITERQ